MQKKILLYLLLQTLQKVHIWEPSSLRSLYKNRNFEYSIANFGTVPYGHSVYGTVFLGTPLNGCQDLKPLKWDKNSGTLIIYLERGNCHFAQKVLNAQKIGAGLVIIGDTNEEDVHKILPIERTTELMNKIRVPSILVQKEDAENIRKVLDGRDEVRTLTMAIHFSLVKADAVATIRLILQVDDFRSYDSLIALSKYRNLFRESMNLKVHYKVFKNMPAAIDKENCVDNQHVFCVLNTNLKVKKNLLRETVRQLCLFNYNWELFIGYFKKIRNECFEGDELKDGFEACANEAFEGMLSYKAKDDLKTCLNPTSSKAFELLEKNNDDIKYYLLNYSPIVFINGYMYKGNYRDSNHLMEAFCNSFEEAPKGCENLDAFKEYNDFSSAGIIKFIIISVVVTLFIIFFLVGVFYIFYRKKIHRNFKTELNTKINEALSKYYIDNKDTQDYKGIIKDDIKEVTKEDMKEEGNAKAEESVKVEMDKKE